MKSKLAFREDEAAGVVRCYLSAIDDSERTELATLSLGLLRAQPGLFNAWVALMQGAYGELLKKCGFEVVGFHEFKPHDKN